MTKSKKPALLPNGKPRISKEEYKKRKEELAVRLSRLQRKAIDQGIPIVIVFEGWDAAGKGVQINKLIQTLDPRGFQVISDSPPAPTSHQPFLTQYAQQTPAQGRIAIFDRSWYRYLLDISAKHKAPGKVRQNATRDILAFEQQLTDSGTLIIKLFLHISQKEQARRFAKLKDNPATRWRITAADEKRHHHYDRYADATEDMLARTSTTTAPWTILSAKNRRYATITIMQAVADALEHQLGACLSSQDESMPGTLSQALPIHDSEISLESIDLSASLSREVYEQQLKEKQDELSDLQNMLYVRKRPMIILYEGWDAAGKGGNIRRLTQPLDPRGYEVVPIAAPTPTEKKHHYLWRFWQKMPAPGHITIFDRTWYGRVLVERVEGFCPESQWQRAYGEINALEEHLTQAGMIVLKFWLQIDQDEQLRRFEERQNTPYKKWKITEEDWRNREKWPQYEQAVQDMLQKTHTPYAPWTVLAANSKLHARIQALDTTIKTIKNKL